MNIYMPHTRNKGRGGSGRKRTRSWGDQTPVNRRVQRRRIPPSRRVSTRLRTRHEILSGARRNLMNEFAGIAPMNSPNSVAYVDPFFNERQTEGGRKRKSRRKRRKSRRKRRKSRRKRRKSRRRKRRR